MKLTGKRKKGITLVELIVAMGIFAVVTTLSIGAFVTITRMQALTNNMKNTQQKIRVAIEMMGRLGRQASVVLVPNTNEVDMYFDLDGSQTPHSGSRFRINGGGLLYSECSATDIDAVSKQCKTNLWKAESDLLSGVSGSSRLTGTSSFVKLGSIPPVLDITLNSATSGTTNPYYSDSLNIVDEIVLEQVQ